MSVWQRMVSSQPVWPIDRCSAPTRHPTCVSINLLFWSFHLKSTIVMANFYFWCLNLKAPCRDTFTLCNSLTLYIAYTVQCQYFLYELKVTKIISIKTSLKIHMFYITCMWMKSVVYLTTSKSHSPLSHSMGTGQVQLQGIRSCFLQSTESMTC